MGKPLPQGPVASDPDIVRIGVAVFLLAVVCLTIYGRRRSLSRSPVGPALICFGILFAVWVTIGRTYLGLWAASQSRYETQNLLILVGCYLCLLERWPAHDEEIVTASFTVHAFRNVDQLGRTIQQKWREGLLLGIRVLALLLIVVEVEGGIANGIPSGAGTRKAYQLDNLVAAHAADAPDSLIQSALFPNHGYLLANIRGLAEAAKKDHLSFFATSESSRLARMNLPKTEYSLPETSVVKPAGGALLRGQIYLVAKASSNYPITSVDFQIRRSGGQQVKLLRGHTFPYGWLGIWFTTNLPNGSYTVQSIAKDITGHSSTSQAVPIAVEN
jgi:hypothetical protein